MASLTGRVAGRLMSLPPPVERAVRVERDVPVPMSDGVELVADVYTPGGSGPYPTVLVRSPYGRRGPLGLFLGRVFAERGYRVLLQSCRGTFGSGGEFEPHFAERADGLATIEWIKNQAWFDGRLAMNGPSYLGQVQWAVADAGGPELQALCTHVAYSAIVHHWYRGGSFALGDAIEWSTMVADQERRRAGVREVLGSRQRRIDRVLDHLPIAGLDREVLGRSVPFWHEFVDHPTTDDPFWAPIDHSVRPAHVAAPVLQVAGWYDIFLPDQLADHRALRGTGHPVRLVVGPWTHTAGSGFRAQLAESLRWLDEHVRGGGAPAGDRLQVRLFVMGADRWRDVASWPPEGYRPEAWHLHAGARLDPAPPVESEPDRYTYDPHDPTPIAGGTLLRRTGGRRDQGRTEARADVLIFTGERLRADVEVVGEVTADVHVGSDLDHFDVFVRLCDVDSKGRSRNVCDGIERVSPARWPRPPGGVWAVRVVLWPTAHRFRVGHRLRVQVSSGAHPRFARNLGTGEPLATATTTRVAHQAIYHDLEHPSAITLPVGRV